MLRRLASKQEIDGDGGLKKGASNSVQVLTVQLMVLLEKQGTTIRTEIAQGFIKTILEFNPWFSQAGVFNIPDWEQVEPDLQKALKEWGPEEFPMEMFSFWCLVKDALLNDNRKVKKQLDNLAKTFEEIQESAGVDACEPG